MLAFMSWILLLFRVANRQQGLGQQQQQEQRYHHDPRVNNSLKKHQRDILAVVGVFTSFLEQPPKRDSFTRRDALRSTWFPPNEEAIDAMFNKHGIIMRYHALPRKTLKFFHKVSSLFPEALYVIKVDDDVYANVDRLPQAIRQWEEDRHDYVSCMKTGKIFTDPWQRWYEPQHALLGAGAFANQPPSTQQLYFLHAWGSAYAISMRAANALSALAVLDLPMRLLANEDTTLGLWMLAMNMRHGDDRRMCEKTCSETSVIVYDMPKCAGLCHPVSDALHTLHESAACRAARDADASGGHVLQRAPPYFVLPKF
ncbi:glycosyltransferase family 31 protein [Pseudoscourfieldia marina]